MNIYYKCPKPLHRISGQGIETECFLIFPLSELHSGYRSLFLGNRFYDNIYRSSLSYCRYEYHFFRGFVRERAHTMCKWILWCSRIRYWNQKLNFKIIRRKDFCQFFLKLKYFLLYVNVPNFYLFFSRIRIICALSHTHDIWRLMFLLHKWTWSEDT
jgi:hypothetical protein